MQLRLVFRIKSVVFVWLRYLRARAIANTSRKLCLLWEILRPSRYFLDKKCFLLTCAGQSYFTLTFLSSNSIPTSINYVSFCLLVKCSVKITSSCIFRYSSCVPTSSETWGMYFVRTVLRLILPFCNSNLFNPGHLGCVPDRIGISKSWLLRREENRSTRRKNLWEQGREPTTNSTHIWCWRRAFNPGHIGGRRVLSPLRHPCSPSKSHYPNTNSPDWSPYISYKNIWENLRKDQIIFPLMIIFNY